MVTPASLFEYLEGIDYPVTKEEFVDYAESRGAPREVIETLASLPEGTYYSMAALRELVSVVE